MQAVLEAVRTGRDMRVALEPWLALHDAQHVLNACHPFNGMTGADGQRERLWRPLLAAMPDLERRPDLLMTGRWQDFDWVAHCGHFVGSFMDDLALGGGRIRASRRPAWIRYGAFDKVADGRIVESYLLLDLASLLIACGQWPLAPSLGVEGVHPAPATADGLRLDGRTADEAARSLALVEAMIGGLMRYDGRTLASMGMRQFWTPEFHWYGPGGIGSARGHADYERAHQGPFLAAFPDRKGGNHKCRIGDGMYVASTGWPSIRATHTGGSWLGLAPTGRPVTMRVMDFWRREGDLLAENWVFIDVLDLALQMGVDVLARAAAMRN